MVQDKQGGTDCPTGESAAEIVAFMSSLLTNSPPCKTFAMRGPHNAACFKGNGFKLFSWSKYLPEVSEKKQTLPLGVVLRKSPGVTRWAKWVWRAVAVLPGAGPASWRELRREGEVVEYHAATVPLELYRTDTEAYLTELSTKVPSIYVVMRENAALESGLEVVLATASPFDGQDYADNGEDIVELVPMPPALQALVREWVDLHHKEEKFKKRRRDKKRTDLVEDGIGDARISQAADVYRAPASKRETLH